MRYEMLRLMGEETPLDRPDFDPNNVGTPDDEVTTRVEIGSFLDRKMDALRCHRSQVAPDWWFMRIPHDQLLEKFNREFFSCMASHIPVHGEEDDLFAGLR
jgi:LmbE family N-acetylglucosaminyl deacetylase